MTTQYDVVALGELLMDFTPWAVSDGGNPVYEANPGGAPCNVLAQLNRLGRKTAFIGKVGDDVFGHRLKGLLEELGIGTDGLLCSATENTTLAFVDLDAQGERDFSFIRKNSADIMLQPQEVDFSLIEQCRIFHCGSLSMTHEPSRTATLQALERAKAAGKLISVDPNLRMPLWDSPRQAKAAMMALLSFGDIVKLSDYELAFLCGDGPLEETAHRLFRQLNPKVMAVTCGRDGAYLKTSQVWRFQPSFRQVQVADTTGAGDSFVGAMLHQILSLDTLSPDENQAGEILRFASAAAALVTTRKGAIRSMAAPAEIAALMASP